MAEDTTVKAMSITFPEATKRLLSVIEETEGRATAGDEMLHDSEGYVMSRLVEPVMEALGFDRHRQRMEFTPFEHLILSTAGIDAAMLILATLGEHQGVDQWVENARRESRFRGRIIVTNGVDWSIYYPDAETPDHHFGLTEPGAFWELLVMGQANDQQELPKPNTGQ